MKTARFVLKCVSAGLIVGAAVCAVIAYWDRIMDAWYCLTDRLEEMRAQRHASEYDDYADFEDWDC